MKVKLPPGPFLQASREAETVMVDLVRDGVGAAKRVADLFAGLGTFTFALAGTAAVDAFEADEAALTSLAEAARKTPRLKPIRTFARDLFRFSRLHNVDLVICGAAGVFSVMWFEALKVFGRGRIVTAS